MPSKKHSAKLYVLITAAIAVFIVAEWISVFFFGRVPAGYP
jgi:flagellar basal body-associated protein FliL